VTESELRSALSSKPHQRQLQIVDRVLPAPAAVAVPVRVAGSSLPGDAIALAVSVAAFVLAVRTHSSSSIALLVLPVIWPLVLPQVSRMTGVLFAARVRPLRLRWDAILAVDASTVSLVSVSPWALVTSRPAKVKASWPRHHIVVELATRRRWGIRKVTLRCLDGTTFRLEARVVARWVDPALTELVHFATTGSGTVSMWAAANWYADPASSAGLRYWDGQAWTSDLLSDPWRPRGG
jgi:hypothetical protein